MVIDISFETMGGILAASFLATLDQLISERCKGHGMLFTRSVILASPYSCLSAALRAYLFCSAYAVLCELYLGSEALILQWCLQFLHVERTWQHTDEN